MLSYTLQKAVSSLPGYASRINGSMGKPSQIVYVVAEDARLYAEICEAVACLEVRVEWFRSAMGYYTCKRPTAVSCLLIGSRLTDMTGLELQRMLIGTDSPPIILLSEKLDIPSCVRAIKEGAHDVFTLPFVPSDLLRAMQVAFESDRTAITRRKEHETLKLRWRSLTIREAEVMRYAVGGFLNKQTASEMRITENTVQVHRGRAMRKMGADSFAEFVRMSLRLADSGEDSLLCS